MTYPYTHIHERLLALVEGVRACYGEGWTTTTTYISDWCIQYVLTDPDGRFHNEYVVTYREEVRAATHTLITDLQWAGVDGEGRSLHAEPLPPMDTPAVLPGDTYHPSMHAGAIAFHQWTPPPPRHSIQNRDATTTLEDELFGEETP